MTVAGKVIVWLVPTMVRLDTDCPMCGWADLWRVTVHTLTDAGVGQAAEMIHCARCENQR